MFRNAFFTVVIPWMRVTIRAENECREKCFVRDWVEERFIFALLEERLEEQVTFPLYRGVVVDAKYRY